MLQLNKSLNSGVIALTLAGRNGVEAGNQDTRAHLPALPRTGHVEVGQPFWVSAFFSPLQPAELPTVSHWEHLNDFPLGPVAGRTDEAGQRPGQAACKASKGERICIQSLLFFKFSPPRLTQALTALSPLLVISGNAAEEGFLVTPS